mgnify:FL=1
MERELRVPELAHHAVHHNDGARDVRVRLVHEPHSAVDEVRPEEPRDTFHIEYLKEMNRMMSASRIDPPRHEDD